MALSFMRDMKRICRFPNTFKIKNFVRFFWTVIWRHRPANRRSASPSVYGGRSRLTATLAHLSDSEVGLSSKLT